jgi:hypothetical protein
MATGTSIIVVTAKARTEANRIVGFMGRTSFLLRILCAAATARILQGAGRQTSRM